jgi:hypothetical protein
MSSNEESQEQQQRHPNEEPTVRKVRGSDSVDLAGFAKRAGEIIAHAMRLDRKKKPL